MSHVEFMMDSKFNLDTVFISLQTMLRLNRAFYAADFRGHFDEMVYSADAYNTVIFNPGASRSLVSGIIFSISRAGSEPVWWLSFILSDTEPSQIFVHLKSSEYRT